MVGICFFFFDATIDRNATKNYHINKHILFKHKPDSVDDIFSVQLLPENVANIIQIKEALTKKHTSHRAKDVFFCNLCS